MRATKSKKDDTAILGAAQLLTALKPFVDLRQRITSINHARSFLAVAADEGRNVNNYANTLDIAQSTMSRNLLDLSGRDRNMNEGPQLIEGMNNPENLHEKLYFLTPKGREFLADLTKGAK